MIISGTRKTYVLVTIVTTMSQNRHQWYFSDFYSFTKIIVNNSSTERLYYVNR